MSGCVCPLLWRVVEVQPDDAGGAVSLIETDVEVDIAPSQDYEEAMRRLVGVARSPHTRACTCASIRTTLLRLELREAFD